MPARNTSSKASDIIVSRSLRSLHPANFLREKQIVLTLDDGPDVAVTRPILAALRKHRVPAMFFSVGIRARSHPDVVREIVNDGHVLASHSFNHNDLSKVPVDEALHNIRAGHRNVQEIVPTDKRSHFFRFPLMAASAPLRTAVAALGLLEVPTEIVTPDWIISDPATLLTAAIATLEMHKAGVVLFHDNLKQTALIFDDYLAAALKRGYQFVVFRSEKETGLAHVSGKLQFQMREMRNRMRQAPLFQRWSKPPNPPSDLR